MNTRPNAYEIPAVQLALMFARLATRGPAAQNSNTKQEAK